MSRNSHSEGTGRSWGKAFLEKEKAGAKAWRHFVGETISTEARVFEDKEEEVRDEADKIKGVLTLPGLLSQVKESWILFLNSWKPLKKNLKEKNT